MHQEETRSFHESAERIWEILNLSSLFSSEFCSSEKKKNCNSVTPIDELYETIGESWESVRYYWLNLLQLKVVKDGESVFASPELSLGNQKWRACNSQ